MFLESILLGTLISMGVSNDNIQSNEIMDIKNNVSLACDMVSKQMTDIEYEEPVISESSYISEDDISLIALITMAEAEGECSEGQRLVIDTILNRVDSDAFPNTIYDVIYQPGQFECVYNGRIHSCYVRDDIYQLVLEEMDYRYNYDVTFFRTCYYSEYGNPLFQVGNHYFSSYY
jgi:N-acetylmuramoyl-L-alanine amidase